MHFNPAAAGTRNIAIFFTCTKTKRYTFNYLMYCNVPKQPFFWSLHPNLHTHNALTHKWSYFQSECLDWVFFIYIFEFFRVFFKV